MCPANAANLGVYYDYTCVAAAASFTFSLHALVLLVLSTCVS